MAEIDPDTMATPWRRDPSETAPALQRWAENAMGAGVVVSEVGEPGNGMSSETALFTITPQNAYTGPSLHAVDGTLLLRPGRNGEAVAGSFPRVRADVATGTAIVPGDRVERGLARLAKVVPGLGRVRAGRAWLASMASKNASRCASAGAANGPGPCM